MVIYARLPKSIYPAMRHVIYHPKLAENIFPDQPILQELATENSFLTITENNELNKMQRNLLREWLMNPVAENHPVFQTADFLTSMELSTVSDTSESLRNVTLSIVNETSNNSQRYADNEGFTSEEVFVPATEEHPLADVSKQKKKKKKRKMKFSFKKPPRHASRDIVEDTHVDFESSVEMDLYNNRGMSPETANTFF